MAHVTSDANPPRRRVLEISPSAVLAGLALAGLVFIAHLDALAAALFLGAGGLLIVRQPGRILTEHLAQAPLYALPGLCLLSTLWSVEPGLSFRFGLQLLMTFTVIIAIAAKVRPGTVVRMLLVLFIVAGALSATVGGIREDGAWLGIFGSKNAFAQAMSLFVLVSAAILLDRREGRFWRLLALAAAVPAVALLALAQSAGAMILAGLAVGCAPLIWLAARLGRAQRLAAALVFLLVAALAGLAAIALSDVLFAALLDATGKDVTLTGRTELWRFGRELIFERPLLGLGYQAFWVQGNPDAEMLWQAFHIESRSGFNFHNTWINNAVEIGLVGMAIQLAIVLGALWHSVAWALRAPSASSVFFAILTINTVIASFVEVVVFLQFNLWSALVLLALLYARRPVRPANAPAAAAGAA
jgi:exopolysaccharide production protein ExoQ